MNAPVNIRTRLVKTIKGQWLPWRKGTTVTAKKQDDGTFFIERVKWNGRLDCINKMANVPADALADSTP